MPRDGDRIELRLLTHRPGLKSSLPISSFCDPGQIHFSEILFPYAQNKYIQNKSYFSGYLWGLYKQSITLLHKQSTCLPYIKHLVTGGHQNC